VTRIEHKRSALREALTKRIDAIERGLNEANDEALRVVEAQNADINFDLDHRMTRVKADDNGIRVGTVSPSYAYLMTMDGEEVAEVYRKHFQGEG
jgi:hypothetical protein